MIIRKSNPIPVQPDGAGGIPPALGVENCSAGSSSAPAAPSLGSGRNNTNAIRQHSPVSTKVEDSVCNDAADQAGTVVMIGHPFARPFLWIPVHSLCAAPKAEPPASP